MLTFSEFLTVKGRNAGYNKGDMCAAIKVSSARLKTPEKITLGEIRYIRDLLNIPEWEMEKYVLRILRDGMER